MNYDPQIAAVICEQIATTPLALEDILAGIPESPSIRTIYNWLDSTPEFVQSYARAREMQGDYYVDLAVKESHNSRIGEIRTEKFVNIGGEAMPVTETKIADNVERSKLIVQTLLKRAGQLAPKKYGDKTLLTNADGNGPVEFVVKSILEG